MIRISTLFPRTLREAPREAEARSHELLLRAGCIRRTAPGVYTWLPLGLRLLRAVSEVVREEMDAIGGQEVLLPALLPRSAFEPTGRWDEFGDGLFRLQDRTGTDYLLGPTHEEVFAALVGAEVSSYRDLPLTLYQIQTKYRDELRSRGGLLRGREFVMKDSYSFDLDEEGLAASYAAHRSAYERALSRLGITYSVVAATAGAMGGSASEEFLAHSEAGEDTFLTCSAGHGANLEVFAERSGIALELLDEEALCCLVCAAETSPRRGIEVGHIFQLGRKYTDALGVSLTGADGKPVTPLMGSYGIGVSRLVAVLAEQFADAKGLCWPSLVAPIQVQIVALGREGQLEAAESLARDLEARGWRVGLDDREARMGVMMSDAELLGAPWIVVVGRGLASGQLELVDRATGSRHELRIDELAAFLAATR